MESEEIWMQKKAVGNITESIVEFLIKSCPDWKCIKFGMENHIDELKKSLRDNNADPTSQTIRSMPDFIAINQKTNQVLLVDAKFRGFIDKRKQGEALYGFGYGQIKTYLERWPAVYLFVIHPYEPYFSIIRAEDIKWHVHFHSRTDVNERMIENWNFAGIQKDIKEIFPEITEETIKKAIEMIPGRKT